MKCWSWSKGRFAWSSGYRWNQLSMKGTIILTNQGQWVPFFLGIFYRVDNIDYTNRDLT